MLITYVFAFLYINMQPLTKRTRLITVKAKSTGRVWSALSHYYFTMRYSYIKSTYTKWSIHADHTLCDMELSGITWVQYGVLLYCRVWEVESGKCYKMLPHPTFVYSAKFHPRVSKVIVTGSYDNTVRVWHIDGTEIQGMLICIWWFILICLL